MATNNLDQSGAADLRFPKTLTDENEEGTARRYVREYFLGSEKRGPYTGSYFETLGHAWSDPVYVNTVTASDILALSMLSVEVPGEAVVALLEDEFQREASALLVQIPVDATIVNVDAATHLASDSPASRLYELLRKGRDARFKGFGQVRRHKLLARKRPGLLPVYDRYVAKTLHISDSRGFWMGMHNALKSHPEVWEFATRLHQECGLPEHVTPLRVIDVVMWRTGKDISARKNVETAADEG